MLIFFEWIEAMTATFQQIVEHLDVHDGVFMNFAATFVYFHFDESNFIQANVERPMRIRVLLRRGVPFSWRLIN